MGLKSKQKLSLITQKGVQDGTCDVVPEEITKADFGKLLSLKVSERKYNTCLC